MGRTRLESTQHSGGAFNTNILALIVVCAPSSSVMVTDAIISPWLGINVHWTPNEPSRQVSFHLISTGEVGVIVSGSLSIL